MIYLEFGDMWAGAVNWIRSTGSKLDSRVGPTREVLAWQGTITDPRRNVLLSKTRHMSPSYACGEMLWYLSGDRTADRVLIQAPSYKRFLNDGIANGAYGERWERFGQLSAVIALLRKSPNTRQAVLSSWFPEDICDARDGTKLDIPCTLNLQFLIRDERLHCITSMRSNDVWLGMPYDVFCFTTLQRIIATELGITMGHYTHRVGSLHIYDRDLEKIGVADVEHEPCEAHDYPKLGSLDSALAGQLDDTLDDAFLDDTLYGDLLRTARTKTRLTAECGTIANPALKRALEIYRDRN